MFGNTFVMNIMIVYSKQEHCETRALQFYLDAGQWELSLDLLRDYCNNSQLHFLLFHRLLDKFNKVSIIQLCVLLVFTGSLILYFEGSYM